MSIQTSEYLKSRRHNGQLLNKLGEEVFGPILDQFNKNNERKVKAEWSMSAKYQSVTLDFSMEDSGNLSEEFVGCLVFGNLADALSEWFAVEADEFDCEDAEYISLDIGL